MKKIKVGVFGGGRGRTMIEQLLNSDEAELVAVCDKYTPLLDDIKQRAESLNVNVALYEKFDDFIKHDMDAVVLANYANEHTPYAIRCLNSGKHVMTEVLCCATMAEAVELIETVERTGLVYSYAENYCYTPQRQEMRRSFLAGEIGELLYAEGEYIHDCASIWPQITYGERDHWRNTMYSTFYNTHSLGPILKMTKLRPVSVCGFESQPSPHMIALGARFGSAGIEMVKLENGAIVKSLHGDIKHAGESRFYLSGSKGGLLDVNDGQHLETYIEGPGVGNGHGEQKSIIPEHTLEGGKDSGHGGADFYTTYFFLHSIMGEEYAKEMTINVYDAVEMTICGILGYKSILDGGVTYKIPNLRNKEERDAYRNDHFPYAGAFPNNGGNSAVPNPVADKDIPDEVYDRVRDLWINDKEG